MKDVNTILVVDDEQALIDAESYYLNNVGMVETASESSYEAHILNDLAECFISPVQSITDGSGETHYGVIDYDSGAEWYGFEVYNGRSRAERRVVGVRELADATDAAQLPHATAGDTSGSFGDNPDATYAELADGMTAYYNETYGEDREDVTISFPKSVNVLR